MYLLWAYQSPENIIFVLKHSPTRRRNESCDSDLKKQIFFLYFTYLLVYVFVYSFFW